MKKFLIIKDKSKFIYFKNRKVRTPATLEVTDDELKKLHIALKMADVQNFEITEDCPTSSKHEHVFVEDNKEVIVEELDVEEEEPSTILEELMRNGENK